MTTKDLQAITVPLDEFVREVAREAAREACAEAWDRHENKCPYVRANTEQRLRGVEIRFAALIGLMAGSGVLGGAAGGVAVAALKALLGS